MNPEPNKSAERQKRIDFDRNYCTHYCSRPGSMGNITCLAGCDIRATQRVELPDGMKWGPCIGGHTLEDPLAHCPKWERRSLEHAEARADAIERSIKRMMVSGPAISAWRAKPKPAHDRAEVIECPVCKGRLHLQQSSYNGRVRACCETKDCINFIE